MNQELRNSDLADDEISFWELVDQIKNGWRWIVGGGVIGLFGSFVAASVVTPQFEAKGVVQPATIGIIFAPTSTSTLVEPITQTLERLNLATFYDDDLLKTCGVNSARELLNDLKASVIKNGNLLSISYRAQSASRANMCLSSVVTHLTQSQASIAAPLVQELQDQQSSTKRQIEELERFLAASEKRVGSSAGSYELSVLMMLKREELFKLQKLYREQRFYLAEPLTQPMKLLGPIDVPERPVAQKKPMIISVGLFAGLFAGVLVLFVHLSWRRHRAMSAGLN